MRLRTLCLIAGGIALVGGGIWAYGSNMGHTTAVGAGGLPLIKADATPVKIAPEEPEGDIIPNADSTVFAAMGTEDTTKDPSMENIATPPSGDEPSSTDFAGFKTGFALPKQPERKTESLFADEKPASDAPQGSAVSKYYSGLAPEIANAEPEETPAPARAPKKETIATEEPKEETVIKTAPEPEPEPEEAPPAAEIPPAAPANENIAARALEAEEKILIRPSSKPAVTKTEPAKKAEAKTVENIIAEVAEKPAYKTPTPPPAQPVPAAPATVPAVYYIQLASAPAGSDTTAAWSQLKNKYPQALAGLNPDFVKVSIAGKGDYVRIQAGPLTQGEAGKRCAAIRAQGGCLVVKR